MAGKKTTFRKRDSNKVIDAPTAKSVSKPETVSRNGISYIPVANLPVMDFDKAKADVVKQRKRLNERMESLKSAYKNGSFPPGGKDALIRSLFVFGDYISTELINNADAMIDLVRQTYTMALELQTLASSLEDLLLLYNIRLELVGTQWTVVHAGGVGLSDGYAHALLDAIRLILPEAQQSKNADIAKKEETLLSLEQEYEEIVNQVQSNKVQSNKVQSNKVQPDKVQLDNA